VQSDKDKPKKQRRKPAIAEVKEEDSIDEVKEEDSISPEAALDAPASDLQPDSPKVKSDVEDEPLSDCDAEPEPKAEQEKKSRKKKQTPTEDDDKATHPPARSAGICLHNQDQSIISAYLCWTAHAAMFYCLNRLNGGFGMPMQCLLCNAAAN